MIDPDWKRIVQTCRSRNEALSKVGIVNEVENNESVWKNMGGYLTPDKIFGEHSDACEPTLVARSSRLVGVFIPICMCLRNRD